MSGRKQHPIWVCFTRDASCSTNIKGTCKGCGEKVQGVIPRLEKHAACCRRLSALGLYGANMLSSSSSSSSSSSQSASQPDSPQVSQAPGNEAAVDPAEPQRKKLCLQTTLPVVRTGGKEHSELNDQLCRFIVSANCPFSLVEDEEFVKFVRLLRPGTKLPTRQTLSGPVLDPLHETDFMGLVCIAVPCRASAVSRVYPCLPHRLGTRP